MEKKYQIFISSTYKDLIKEREKVRDVILSMYQFPIGMEMFSAADEEQWEIIKDTIDSSDYYVLIIGKRYGSVFDDGPEKGMSYTEKEYHYAKSVGIPILVYIKDEKTITADNVEKDAKKMKRLDSFIAEAKKGREAKWFSSVDQLGTEVTLSLHKEMDRKKRPGWIRGDSIDIEKSLSEIVELSKRNRELEEENRILHNAISERKPALSIHFFNYGTREKPIMKGKSLESLRVATLNDLDTMNVPKQLSMDVIHDYPGLDSQKITDYNSKLPTKDAIEKYNDEIKAFRMIIDNGYHIIGELSNGGTIKAVDVTATLVFPEGFLIQKWEKVEKMNPPKKPKIPANPLSFFSMRSALGPLGGITDFAEIMHDGQTEYYGDGKYPIYNNNPLLSSIISPNPTHGVIVENNTVTIWSDDLLHKSRIATEDFCVIPMKKGDFAIKVSLMCEEYIEPEEYEIKLRVE